MIYAPCVRVRTWTAMGRDGRYHAFRCGAVGIGGGECDAIVRIIEAGASREVDAQ